MYNTLCIAYEQHIFICMCRYMWDMCMKLMIRDIENCPENLRKCIYLRAIHEQVAVEHLQMSSVPRKIAML